MKFWFKVTFLAAVLLLGAACRSGPVSGLPSEVEEPLVTAAPRATVTGVALATSPAAVETAVPPPTLILEPTAAAAETVAATATAVPTETAVPTATPDPYAAYTIEALAARSYGGGELQLLERIENKNSFARYLISYPSDGLTIHGFMNVPHEGSKFPVAIVLHGYVDPSSYQTLAYTTRYADTLAEAGYLVIHPNMRGFPPSDDGDDAYRTGLAADVLNLIAIIREQSADLEGPLRRADAEAIHLWGHSMGGGAVLRVVTVLNADYVRAAVLYGAMSGDERQNYEQIMVWSAGRTGEFELAAAPETLQAISPIYHLQRIKTPLSIHHGSGDETVPPDWSADLCARMGALDQPVECFSYNLAPHTFYGDWEDLFNRRVIEFFDRN